MMTAITLLASIKTAKRRANFQLQRSLPRWVSTLLVDEELRKGCDGSEEVESIVDCWEDGEQKGGVGVW